MQVSVDISLYPLQRDYREPIMAFIEKLDQYSDEIIVSKNSMSTSLLGDYLTIMPILEKEMLNSLKDIPESVFVIKLSGGCQ